MAVVMILGIFLAIALPIYKHTSMNTKYKACEASVRVINGAITIYQSDHDGLPANLTDLVPEYLVSVPDCPVDGSAYSTDADGMITSHTHP